jgi:hypothetical protein
MGEQGFGIDVSVVDRIAADIAEARKLGVQVGRRHRRRQHLPRRRGRLQGRRPGDGRPHGHAGHGHQLAGLRTSLVKLGVEAVVLSAIAMPELCESFSQRQATAYIDQGKVVIFAGGTGNPFFTTDSAAALRAAEIGADALFKGTQVDGVYSADPKKDPDRQALRPHHPRGGAARGAGGDGHGGDCSCAREQHSDNRLFDSREGRLRRDSQGRGPLHPRGGPLNADRTGPPRGPRRSPGKEGDLHEFRSRFFKISSAAWTGAISAFKPIWRR